MTRAASDRLTADERREAIISAVADLFAARGFDGVTTRELAEAAGVSEALLYRHFDGKAGLYLAIQEACIEAAAAEAQPLDELPNNTATLVLGVYLMMRKIQFGSEPGELHEQLPRLILRSLLSDGQFARAFFKSVGSRWTRKMEPCVRAAIEAGDLVPDEGGLDGAVTGGWFAHHIACGLVFYRLPGSPVIDYPIGSDPEAQLDRAVRFALRGMGVTAAAVAAYYQPKAFALLLKGGTITRR